MLPFLLYLILCYFQTVTFPVMTGTSVRVTREKWGVIGDQIEVTKFKLVNENGAELHLISYGAAIQKLIVPDNNGKVDDITLGFDHIDGYLGLKARNPYFGAIVGRVANRIAKGKFQIDGTEYHLAINNGENALHGGIRSFSRVDWTGHHHPDGRVTFTYFSPDMEEGYPGDLLAQVTYRLSPLNEVIIDFKAMTSRPTPVSLSSHAYFNLAGHGSGSDGLYDHVVQLNAQFYTPVDQGLIPTGEIRNVEGSKFDLRSPVRLGDVVHQVEGGFDHNFVVDQNHQSKYNGTLNFVAKIKHPPSGRLMEVFSDQPGFQFYTGNFLPSDGSLIGKENTTYSKHGGFCVETQNYPNAVNQANFPDPILQPGIVYQRTAVYKFSVE